LKVIDADSFPVTLIFVPAGLNCVIMFKMYQNASPQAGALSDFYSQNQNENPSFP